MTTLHEHLISGNTSLTNNSFRAGLYSSIGENRPMKQVGIVGICPVVDRSIFDTNIAQFWKERLAQLNAWQSKPPGLGTAHQISGIGSEIAWLTGNFSYLANLNSGKISTALERLRQADEVFLSMQTGIRFLDPGYPATYRHDTLCFGSLIHSYAHTGLIFREGKKWISRLIDTPHIILATTATEHPRDSLSACFVGTASVRPMREVRLQRLVDIYKVEWEWAYQMRESLPADYHCIPLPDGFGSASRAT